jgi:putative FmdB family regulatory protein
MPIYEYYCSQCERDVELLVRGNERPSCPECHSVRLQKQLSLPAAHTSGSRDLPICETPHGGGCGAPACQSGCQFE